MDIQTIEKSVFGQYLNDLVYINKLSPSSSTSKQEAKPDCALCQTIVFNIIEKSTNTKGMQNVLNSAN